VPAVWQSVVRSKYALMHSSVNRDAVSVQRIQDPQLTDASGPLDLMRIAIRVENNHGREQGQAWGDLVPVRQQHPWACLERLNNGVSQQRTTNSASAG